MARSVLKTSSRNTGRRLQKGKESSPILSNGPVAAKRLDQLSKRERNKAEKLQRIKDASLALFLTKGYDEATTREIARIAGVALGTIFVYAENKRDLLFLIYNDDLDAVLAESEQAVSPDAKFLDNMLAIGRFHLAHYGRRPEISRFALREMFFYDTGVQARRFQEIRNRLLDLFTRVARWNHDSRPGTDFELVGHIVFALFQFEVRKFLMTEKIDVDKSAGSFKRQLQLIQQGISAR